MKRLRRILLIAALALLVSGMTSSFMLYHMVHGAPDWYLPHRFTEDEMREFSREADQKVAETLSYASDITAAQRRRYYHPASTEPADQIASRTFTISEQQVNSFFGKWFDADAAGATQPSTTTSHNPISPRLRETIDNNLSDITLAFDDNRVILAGKLKNFGMLTDTVVTLALRPSIDDNGQLWLKIDQVYGGRLPLPLSLFVKPEQKIRDALIDNLPDLQDRAKVFHDGTANRYAVETSLTELLLSCFDERPADPTIFLPAEAQSMSLAVPVRLTQIQVGEGTLSMSVRPLDPTELAHVLPNLVKDYDPDAKTTAQ